MNKKIKPLRKFSQNFLIDKNIIRKMVKSFDPKPEDKIIEIGPGSGAITEELIKYSRDIVLIEIDTRISKILKEKFPDVNLITGDFIKMDLSKLIERKARFIGNIPFNITSPILFKLMDSRKIVEDSLLIVQSEVAKRITAKKGGKEYGILAVLLQAFAETKILFKVPAAVFSPRPRVDSAIIRLRWDNDEKDFDEKIFRKIVKTSFGKRRKTIKNSLKNSIFEDCNFSEIIDLSLRAEQLSISDFINMTKFFERNRT